MHRAAILATKFPDVQPRHRSPPKNERRYNDDGRLQILFVSSNSCIGGVEKVVFNLLKNLDNKRYHITTIVTRLNGPFHALYKKYSDQCFYMVAHSDFKNFLQTNKFDIYHIFNSILAFAHIDQMDGYVVLSTFGDWRWDGHWYAIRRETFMGFIDQIDVITTDNPVNIKLFHEFPIHIPNGIDFPKKVNKKTFNPPIVVWAGRDSGEKCPEAVIETAAKLPGVEFHVAISDLMSASNRFFNIQRMKAAPNIKVTVNATLKQTNEMFNNASIYFNSSMTEGMPIAFLEALSFGCYPVVTEAGDMGDMVEKIGHGIVSDNDPKLNKDYSKDISEALIRLKKKPVAIRKEIIRGLREYHDIDKFIETIEQIYRKEITADKTKLAMIASIQKKKGRANLTQRLKQFIGYAGGVEDPVKFASYLYEALFDLHLNSNIYWLTRVKDMSPVKITEKFLYIFYESIDRHIFETVRSEIGLIEGIMAVEWSILNYVKCIDEGITEFEEPED